VNDHPTNGNGGGGGDFGDEEQTAIADFASLHTSRLGGAICTNAILAGRLGDAIVEIGRDLRWTRNNGARVMRLIAVADRCRDAIPAFRAIQESLEAIVELTETEAKALNAAEVTE
jgi:hypothetical protein